MSPKEAADTLASLIGFSNSVSSGFVVETIFDKPPFAKGESARICNDPVAPTPSTIEISVVSMIFDKKAEVKYIH